jgi:protein tyrosine phosphatase
VEKVVHIKDWIDHGIPSKEVQDEMISLFQEMYDRFNPDRTLINDTTSQQQQQRQRTIVHCRGGVGRTGMWYMLYKLWLGELTPDNFLLEWIKLRMLCMETIQSFEQLNCVAKSLLDKSWPRRISN